MENIYYERQVAAIVNQERARTGLAALKLSNDISYAARIKSQDMRDHQYFNHESPVFGSSFDLLLQLKIDYRRAGENIAKGQKTPQAVMNAWMNSDSHRENILDRVFTEIGVGYVEDNQGDTYWTQLFVCR